MEIQVPQILFQIINFGVVFGALSYLLYKPVLKILEERSNKVQEAQKIAEASFKEKAAIDEEKKKIKKDGEAEAAKIIDAAKKTAEAQAQQIMVEAKKQAKSEIERMKTAYVAQQQQAADNLKSEFNSAVLKVTAKVMGSVFDQKTHEKIINQELKTILQSM